MSVDALRALVCGYPQRIWDRKLLVMLQAFTDDSIAKSGERRLYLAMYAQSAENWIKFSNDWDAVLRAEPSIQYFKMKEAHRRRDQFKGFSEKARNQKVFALAGVIKKHAPWGIHVSISVAEFEKRLKHVSPFPSADPYYHVFFTAIFGLFRIHERLGLKDSCKFIFDRQEGLASKVIPVFDWMFDAAPGDWRDLIDGTPSFEDDKKVLPLQAADMLAWHVRRQNEGTYPREYEGLLDLIVLGGVHSFIEIDKDTLDRITDHHSTMPNLQDIDKKRWGELAAIIATNAWKPS